MSLHRLVAFVSAASLVGLFGFASQAEASNFKAPEASKPAKVSRLSSTATLREKIRNVDIDGCGGRAASASVPPSGEAAW